MAIREAVQIVIDRMSSHPEDFEYAGRFFWVVDNFLNSKVRLPSDSPLHTITEEELEALRVGYGALMYKHFHDKVMECLLHPERYESPHMQRQGSSLKAGTFRTTLIGNSETYIKAQELLLKQQAEDARRMQLDKYKTP